MGIAGKCDCMAGCVFCDAYVAPELCLSDPHEAVGVYPFSGPDFDYCHAYSQLPIRKVRNIENRLSYGRSFLQYTLE